jgi:UrcA family protein
MKKLILLAALVGGGLTTVSGIGHAAHAQPPATRTVAIHYGDLDLGSSAGRSALNHRIRHAIRTACGDVSSADLEGQNMVATCREDLRTGLNRQRDAAYATTVRSGAPATLVARR